MNPDNATGESPESIALEQARLKACADLPLFRRYSGNPLLSRKDWPYPINSVLNAAAVRLADGDTLLLCRIEDRSGLSHLCAARSANGMDDWIIDREPTLMPSPIDYPEEIWGIEDPRIVFVPARPASPAAHRRHRSSPIARKGPGTGPVRSTT